MSLETYCLTETNRREHIT